MRRTNRRPIPRTARAGVEPLEGRTLMAATVPLSPGVATGPTPAITTLTPTFTWSAVAGVNGYQLRVADTTDHVFPITTTLGPTTTTFTPAAGTLLPGRYYAWTIRNVIGVVPGSVHERLHFATPVPPAPVATTAGVLTTVRPTLTWTPVPNATGYVLDVYDQTTRAVVTHTTSASATSYTFAAGALQPGHRFDWNVRDVLGTVTALKPSNTAGFRLPILPRPTTTSPGTFAAADQPVLATFLPTFTWTPVTAVTGGTYLLTLYDRTAGQATPVTLPATATSYTLPAGQLIAGHRYVWNLRLVDGTFTSPAVSPNRYFIAPFV